MIKVLDTASKTEIYIDYVNSDKPIFVYQKKIIIGVVVSIDSK